MGCYFGCLGEVWVRVLFGLSFIDFGYIVVEKVVFGDWGINVVVGCVGMVVVWVFVFGVIVVLGVIG